MHLEDSGLLDC